MSKLYGSIPLSARRTIPTARAHNRLIVRAASWDGAIEVELMHHPSGQTTYSVMETPHFGVGSCRLIAVGAFKKQATCTCGKLFRPNKNQKHCSSACRQKAYRERKKARLIKAKTEKTKIIDSAHEKLRRLIEGGKL